jgi:folate-binding protein YgfZ
MWNEALTADYEELLAGTKIAPLDSHFAIEVAGQDRHAFLHNFCTADIKKLPAGRCCEAFVLNGKGKTIAFVHLLAFVDAIWMIGADRSHAKPLIEHLDRYIIREDVQLADLTDAVELFFGPSENAAGAVGIRDRLPNECFFPDGLGDSVRAATIEIAGFGCLLAERKETVDEFLRGLDVLCVTVASPAAMNSIRIEQGTPWSGSEADESNLPQELQRDDKAISFNKGCYLGQETVARLDALGRVNQLLVRVKFGKDQPEVGRELAADDKIVGRITSLAWSPEFDQWIGFAYVKRAYAKPDSELQLDEDRIATVIG